MSSVGALAASSGSRMLRFAASLGRSNSLRHALSELLTSAPGYALLEGFKRERELALLIRGKSVIPARHPAYILLLTFPRLASALADLLRFRRAVARRSK